MEILLKKRELLDLGDGLQSVKIVCQNGQCWITQSGDNRDHIIGSGDSFIISSKGKVIITATADCRIMLVQSKCSCNVHSPYTVAYNQLKNCLVNNSVEAHLS